MPAIASKSYEKKELIHESNAFVHTLHIHCKSIYCDNCLKKSQPSVKCSKCGQMYYCDKECQQNDWYYHKNECQVFQSDGFRATGSRPLPLIRLFLRLWLTAQNDPEFTTKRHQLYDGSTVSLDELHGTHIDLIAGFEPKIMFEMICFNLKNFDLNFDRKEVLRWFDLLGHPFLYSIYSISEDLNKTCNYDSEESIAEGLFIQALETTRHHRSNTNFYVNGLKLQFYAKESIDLGQTLTSNIVYTEEGEEQPKYNVVSKELTTKSFKAGDVIFKCKPLIHCIENDSKGKHCDNCLKKRDLLEKSGKCGKCFEMYYCDKECQKNDWKYHKKECKVYRNANFDMNSSIIVERLLLRLWLCVKTVPGFAAERHKSFDGKGVSLNDVNVCAVNTVEERLVERSQKFIIFTEICKKLKSYGVDFDPNELLRWYTLIINNKYHFEIPYYTVDPYEVRIYSNLQNPIGAGIYVQALTPNHSCLPNADIVQNGLSLEFRAMKTIEAGDEITIALVQLAQNKANRRKQALMMDLSECKCDRCRRNLDQKINYKEYQSLYDKHKKHWQTIGEPVIAEAFNSSYLFDNELVMYFRKIYGENSVLRNEELVLMLICFSFYSKVPKTLTLKQSEIKRYYQQIEPRVIVTHGMNHPIYKLLKNFSQN